MKIKFQESLLSQTPERLLSSLGYIFITDRRSGQDSFARPLGSGHYPRFHIYINREDEAGFLNLHLDQRPSVYEGAKAHAADYDGEVVEAEALRLSRYFGSGEKKVQEKTVVVNEVAKVSQENISLARDLAEIPDYKKESGFWGLLKRLWR